MITKSPWFLPATLVAGAVILFGVAVYQNHADDAVKPACEFNKVLANSEKILDAQDVKYDVTNDPDKIAAALERVSKEYANNDQADILLVKDANTIVWYPRGKSDIILFFKDACGIIGFEVPALPAA